jgi:hypothetical protein
MRQWIPVLILLSAECSPPKPIPGVVRPGPGEPSLESLPGPMPGFGPFDSYSDALMAACPLILSKPNATAGRVGSQDFQLRWRGSSEYCAWLYYTPDHKYEMSMLTDQSTSDPLSRWKNCNLPPFVDDPRYPPGSLKYIFALHNHPFEDILSKKDIRFIVEMGQLHGFKVATKGRTVQLAVIAFFSRATDSESPTCDGFFQYVPASGALIKWTQTHSQWHKKRIGTVEWLNETDYDIHTE